jgi:hypothetical protein
MVATSNARVHESQKIVLRHITTTVLNRIIRKMVIDKWHFFINDKVNIH